MKLRTKNRVFAVPALVLVLMLSSCATPQKPAVEDPAEKMLQASAQSIENSLRELSAAEQYEKTRLASVSNTQPQPYVTVRGMEQVVTLPWQGPLEQAAAKLAGYAGFGLKITGRAPATPILIVIGKNPATVSDHMRNIGLQAGARARVVVYPDQRLVEVQYANDGV